MRHKKEYHWLTKKIGEKIRSIDPKKGGWIGDLCGTTKEQYRYECLVEVEDYPFLHKSNYHFGIGAK